EGREAFEARLADAVPLSEYLVRELSEQSELKSADGRARFAENARPLFTKVPEGVYRELLLERLAEVVGLPPARLEELWHGRAAAAAPAPVTPPARVAIGARRARACALARTRGDGRRPRDPGAHGNRPPAALSAHRRRGGTRRARRTRC